MGNKTKPNIVEDCMLNKTKNNCDITKCSRCGWNEKEIARRKRKIDKGLVNISKIEDLPIYGIRVNNKKRGKKNVK